MNQQMLAAIMWLFLHYSLVQTTFGTHFHHLE